MLNKFRSWLPVAIAITVAVAAAFVLVQQALRMNANDPQVEISEELSKAVVDVEDPAQFDSPQKLDISQSLSAYWMVADEQGKPLAGTGQFNGQLPEVPKNFLDASRQKGEKRVTWQPGSGPKQALVIRPFQGKTKGFVIAGRSLREVQARDRNLQIFALLGLIIGLAGSLIASLFLPRFALHHHAHEPAKE